MENRYCRILCIIMLLLLCGCSIRKEEEEKLKDLDFTVVEAEEIPTELKEQIEKKKKEVFQLTYEDGGYLYLIVGYGEQPSTGYSITIEDLYETEHYINIKTGIMGPSKTEKVQEISTYPYIVVKIQNSDKKVVFK